MSPDLPTISPRQMQILRLLWQHGPASVRELRDRIGELAYTTVLTTCIRMVEKGLLTREQALPSDLHRSANAFVYAPRSTEAELAVLLGTALPAQESPRPSIWSADRASVERLLAYLATLHDDAGARCADTALDAIAALLERAEVAERTHAPVKRRAKQLPKPKKAQPIELRGQICRVCGTPAPPPSAARQDDLRVCRDAVCRAEAKRRDNLTKQHRYQQRKREAAQATQ